MVAPFAYAASNLMGHLVVLETARHLRGLRHLVYASSSSVYGANQTLPFAEADRVDTPLSLYAATKRADELMSHAYGHLYGLPQTGLRFFTVYGPWGRPDMAYFSFAEAILRGEPITVYDEGRLKRDFTYIDDIVAGVVGCLDRPPAAGRGAAGAAAEHRQPPGGDGVDTDRPAGAGAGPARGAAIRAPPGGRCGGDLCRGGGDRRLDRVRAAHALGVGNSAVCRVVSGVAGGRGRRRCDKTAKKGVDRVRRLP